LQIDYTNATNMRDITYGLHYYSVKDHDIPGISVSQQISRTPWIQMIYPDTMIVHKQ